VFLNAAAARADSTKTATPHSSTQKKSGMNTTNESVVMKTSMGNITIELFADKAPVTVKNFLSYVDEKYYDSTVFHRVIKGFMIQGGGFALASPIKQKTTKAPIKNESDNGIGNDRGTIAMARTQDPNSATSQFFINVVDNKMLNKSARDAGYAVFGKVTEGMDVVDKIRAVATGSSPALALNGDEAVQTMFQDVPATPVIVESVRRVHPKK
jgi:peptidyl-prolyl cis-trans isomerase A (cyclophilin A)